MSLPHVYASQVEYMSENLKYREFITFRCTLIMTGTGADTELGACGRIAWKAPCSETVSAPKRRYHHSGQNMYSHGADPKLDLKHE